MISKYLSKLMLTLSVLNFFLFPCAQAKTMQKNQPYVISSLVEKSLKRFQSEKYRNSLIKYITSTNKFSKQEAQLVLNSLAQIKINNLDGCLFCVNIEYQGEKHTLNITEASKNSIKGSLSGKKFHYTKSKPFSLKKILNLAKTDHHSYLNLFINDVYAELALVMLGVLSIVMIALITTMWGIPQDMYKWFIDKRLNSNYCCGLVDDVEKIGRKMQDHLAACILDMSRTFDEKRILMQQHLNELRTYQEMDSLLSDFDQIEDILLSEKENVREDVFRIINSCSSIKEDIPYNVKCVERFQQSDDIFNDFIENTRVLDKCLDLAKSVRGQKKFGRQLSENGYPKVRKITDKDRKELKSIVNQNKEIKTFFRVKEK